MTSLIPLYLKTTYKNDPLFKGSKCVFTLYNNKFSHKFKSNLIEKVKMIDIEDDMLSNLKSADFEGLVKLGIEYSDAVITSGEETNKGLNGIFEALAREQKVETIEKDENFTDSYYNLYNELVG